MKNVIISLIVLCLIPGCAYRYIDSGYVGVRVNASGTNRGVDPKQIGVGRAWYNPLTEAIYEFPAFEQNVLWAKGNKEGDESITISSSQSAQINVDIGMTFEIADDKIPVLFDKLRKDIDYISHQWMRNHVREQLGRIARKVDTMSLLGEGGTQALDDAKTALNKDLAEYGITVKMLSFASSPRPEGKIQASIDATITAKQLAIQAENKVAESKAIAAQSVETAKGEAESIELKAKAKLEASKLEAQANEVISKSLTPELVKYKTIEKWNGELPKFTGQSVPLVDIGNLK